MPHGRSRSNVPSDRLGSKVRVRKLARIGQGFHSSTSGTFRESGALNDRKQACLWAARQAVFSLRKPQRPLDRLEARPIAQPIEQRFPFSCSKAASRKRSAVWNRLSALGTCAHWQMMTCHGNCRAAQRELPGRHLDRGRMTNYGTGESLERPSGHTMTEAAGRGCALPRDRPFAKCGSRRDERAHRKRSS